MNSDHSPAIVGTWKEYTTGGMAHFFVLLDFFDDQANVTSLERLVSVLDPYGIVIIALAGIWLSWSTRYIKKITGNVALWLHLWRYRQYQQPIRTGDPTEDTSLLDTSSEAAASKDARPLARILQKTSGVRDLFVDLFRAKELKKRIADKLCLFLFTAVVVMLVAGLIVGGYFLTNVRVDGAARLASEKCGLWLFEGEKRSEAATRARMLDLEKEERAAQFAEDCYGRPSIAVSRCKVFHQPRLPGSAPIYTNKCPFAPEICLRNQSVTFDTEIIDAKVLGINSPSTPKFRRSTTCTPLSMAYPFVQNSTSNGTTTYTYHYGTKTEGSQTVDHTYTTVGDPWDRLAPIYDLFAYSSNADESDHPVWTPHSSLTHPRYSTVTIVFVSSLRILYEERSDDFIFPADEEYYLPDDPRPWFRNSDPRARPLACINTIVVCTPDGKTCWNINEPTNSTTAQDNTPEFVLLYSSLYKTDLYYSLAKRQGRSLLAQKLVSQYFSAALGDEHWVAEVQNWVRTALARTSINTWSVASGEDAVHEGKGGFTELTRGYDLCGKYIYNPRGYQSLRFWYIIMVFLWLPMSLVLSCNGKWFRRPLIACEKLGHGMKQLLIEYAYRVCHRHDQDVTATPNPIRGPSPTITQADEVGTEQEESSTSQWQTLLRPAIQQQADSQSSQSGDIVIGSSTEASNGASDQDTVQWQPTIAWQLGYGLGLFLYCVGLFFALLSVICLEYLLRGSRLVMRNCGIFGG
jgi:hypothetical protein